jgi:sortase A
VGRTLVGLGILVLAFVAYQLWGTSLSESHAQQVLRHQLSGRLGSSPTVGAQEAPPGRSSGSLPAAGAPGVSAQAPSEGAAIGIIKIPKIGVDKVFVEGTGTADLREGPGHYSGTPLPGQPGNASIAGHRTTYGAPFSRLDDMRPGDQILVTTQQGTFRYDATRSEVVDPSNVSVIGPTTAPQLTLTTCTPRFSAAQRLIVQASLVGSPALGTPVVRDAKSNSSNLAGDTGNAAPVVAWGAATAAIGVGLWLLARTRRRRWIVYVVGTPGVLATLFMTFAATSKLLPTSI